MSNRDNQLIYEAYNREKVYKFKEEDLVVIKLGSELLASNEEDNGDREVDDIYLDKESVCQFIRKWKDGNMDTWWIVKKDLNYYDCAPSDVDIEKSKLMIKKFKPEDKQIAIDLLDI